MSDAWPTRPLGELCEIELGRTPSRGNAAFWDDKKRTSNVWLSIADLLDAKENVVADSAEYVSDEGARLCKTVRKGTLLVSFKLTLGRLAYAGRDLFTNEAIAALPLISNEVTKEYLFWYLQHFDWQKAAEGDEKVKGKTLNKAKLEVLPVIVPPLAEQERIVGILDEAFAAIATAKANTEKNLQNARAVFEGAVDGVFSKLRRHLPGRPLAECVESISTGPFGSLLHKSDYQEGGIPLVNPINIEGDKIVPDPRKAVGKATAKTLARYALREGDVVTARRGEIGRCAAVSAEHAGWLCGTGSFFIRPDKRLDADFLTHLLRSRPYRSQLERASDRATMPSIGNDDLCRLIVHVPPMAEQQLIKRRLAQLSSGIERQCDVCTRKLVALDALKASLLHHAFTGRLTAKTIDATLASAT